MLIFLEFVDYQNLYKKQDHEFVLLKLFLMNKDTDI